MAKLRLTVAVPAPREQVYQFVTSFGPDGPVSPELFRERHGETVEREGSTLVTRETVAEQPITWRCTFEYPERRVMVAVDSTWSDRVDVFTDARRGTRWTVTFWTKREGVVGAVQWLFFQALGRRRVSRRLVGPVVDRFRGDGTARG